MATLRWNSESAVNTTLEGHQERGRVAALATGGYVVVWQDNNGQGSQHVRARVFDNAGQPILGELTLAAGTEAVFHSNPDVSDLADGGFQVVWTRNASGGISRSIASAVFTSTGALVRNIAVTAPLGERQDDTAAIARSGTGAAITWQRHGVAGPLLVTVDSAGTVSAVQSEASAAASFNATPGIAAAPDGSRIAVAWLLDTVGQVRVQLHGGTGAPYGTAAVVATNAGGYALFAPVVAWLAGGLFAVAWSSSQNAAPALGSEVMMRLSAPGLPNAEPVPLGPAFQVNGTSAGFQANVSLTATPGGGVVATWTDSGADGSGRSVRLQAFDGAGRRIGGEYRVTVEEDGVAPDIAALAHGGFVVAWYESQDGGNAIRAQEFNALGFAISGELTIAGGTTGLPMGNPAVAGMAGGVAQSNIVMAPMGTGTAVAWSRGLTVKLRLLDSGGTGPTIDIAGPAGAPALAVAPNLARVAVAWPDQIGLRVQLRDATGAAVGSTTTVIEPVFGAAFAAQVVWLSNTTFAVAWEQDGPSDAGTDIHVRLFATNGSATPVPLTDPFIANATRAGDQEAPRLVALPPGGMVLAWHTNGDDGSAVWLQAFDAGGTRIGGEYMVSAYGETGAAPAITALRDGRVAVAWRGTGDGAPPLESDIHVQIIDPRQGIVTIRTAAFSINLATFQNIENVTLIGGAALSATGTNEANLLDGASNGGANVIAGSTSTGSTVAFEIRVQGTTSLLAGDFLL